MASEYQLGPSIESVFEPGVQPTLPPGRIGIEFHSAPTEPGGRVNVKLARGLSASDKRPSFIHAVYVNPPESVPLSGVRTPQWFMESSHPKAFVEVPKPPAPADQVMTVVVPRVKPGVHFVQTVLEYQV